MSYIHRLSDAFADTDNSLRYLLGGKGAFLVRLRQQGFETPPAIIIDTAACKEFIGTRKLPASLMSAVMSALNELRAGVNGVGAEHRPPDTPFLLSIRSGAPESMPGMLKTLLNVGFDPASEFETPFLASSYLRFLISLAQTRAVDKKALDNVKYLRNELFDDMDRRTVNLDRLTLGRLDKGIKSFRELLEGSGGVPDFEGQVEESIRAVMNSWNSPEAELFRRSSLTAQGRDSGTAVIVQSMVFGNLADGKSGSGVAYSRDPGIGTDSTTGNFLLRSQGEDVVTGNVDAPDLGSLKEVSADLYQELVRKVGEIEGSVLNTVAEVEFTIEAGKLWILQARRARLGGHAAVKFAYDCVMGRAPGSGENWTRDQALRWTYLDADRLLKATSSRFQAAPKIALGRGIAVSPGVVNGVAAFTAEQVRKYRSEKLNPILIADNTTTEQIETIEAAAGIVNLTSSMSSHSIVVARGWNKPVVAGLPGRVVGQPAGLKIDGTEQQIFPGEEIAIDGGSGELFEGHGEIAPPVRSDELESILEWCDSVLNLRGGPKLRVNADTAAQIDAGLASGAAGVGLVRFEEIVKSAGQSEIFSAFLTSLSGREDLLSATSSTTKTDELRRFDRYSDLRDALALAYRSLFSKTIGINNSVPIGVRLVDVLPEFLRPSPAPSIHLGDLRGAQIFVVAPAIYLLQIDAISDALLSMQNPARSVRHLEILVPFCMSKREFDLIAAFVRNRLSETLRATDPATGRTSLEVRIGAMIETPRSFQRVAEYVEAGANFISLGLNDLTELFMGLTRDAVTVRPYRRNGLLSVDPVQTLDPAVLDFVRTSLASVKSFEIQVAAEQANDSQAVIDLVLLGASVFSCVPARFDGLRLSAAKAVIARDTRTIAP